jgi:predicted ester cyclase
MVQTSLDTEKIAFRILDGIFNVGDFLVVDETCSKDIVVHVPGIAEDLKGIEAFKGFMKSFQEAFTDVHLHVDDMHVEGDIVDAHATITANNVGSFFKIPATHTQVMIEPNFFFKFNSDGKVAEFWQEIDTTSLTR